MLYNSINLLTIIFVSMRYLLETYKIRSSRIRQYMLNKDISSVSELVKDTDISSSNMSKALNNMTVSEKYARTLEETHNLPRLYFDLDEILVENKGYTLESFKEKSVAFRVKNVDIHPDCFYIQLIDEDFYSAGTLILFKPYKKQENKGPEPNKIYLINFRNEFLLVKSRVLYLITYQDEKIKTQDVEIIAEQLRVEF